MSQCCVLMIVQPDNFNIADERPIEYGLWEDHNIPCYRCEWPEVLRRTSLTTTNHKLIFRIDNIGVQTELEVSVIYYRAGYTADEYLDDQGRQTRLRLEMARAIKCPDVLTHLTTFKAVQQALTEEGAVERFMSIDAARRIRETYMPMMKMNTSPSQFHGIATDSRQAAGFILKPNLEGGGHNIYGENIPTFLTEMPRELWAKYILMRRILPPSGKTPGALATAEGLYEGPVVSELGILGSVLWRKGEGGRSVEVLRNLAAGWTFKTKPAHVDEMSVVKGYGCFDCPELVA